MNSRERNSINKTIVPPTNIQETDELRYFQRTVTQALEIKQLKIQVGELQSYIAELEDTEKKEQRYRVKEEAEYDRLRKQINKLLADKGQAKDELVKAQNKIRDLGQQIVKLQHKLNAFTKPTK